MFPVIEILAIVLAPAPPPPPAVATANPANDDVGNVGWNPNRATLEAHDAATAARINELEARLEARIAALGHAAPPATPTTTTTTTPVENADVTLTRPDVTGPDTYYNERHLIKNEEVLHRKMPEIAYDENLSTRKNLEVLLDLYTMFPMLYFLCMCSCWPEYSHGGPSEPLAHRLKTMNDTMRSNILRANTDADPHALRYSYVDMLTGEPIRCTDSNAVTRGSDDIGQSFEAMLVTLDGEFPVDYTSVRDSNGSNHMLNVVANINSGTQYARLDSAFAAILEVFLIVNPAARGTPLPCADALRAIRREAI